MKNSPVGGRIFGALLILLTTACLTGLGSMSAKRARAGSDGGDRPSPSELSNHPDHLEEAMAPPTSAPPPFMPHDRLVESELRFVGDGKRAASHDELFAALDGDPESALSLEPGDAIELHFRGAPRWFNFVEPLTDARSFDLEVLDMDRQWLPYEIAVDGTGAKTALRVESDPVKVRGLRFTARQGKTIGEPVRLFEMSAWFHQDDPDQDAQPQKAGPILEYFWANDYPGNDNDLSLCDDDARGLRDHLPGSWTKWGHGNNGARERYIKRQDMGGSNQYHNDAADLSYFAGHGTGSTWDSRWNRNLGAPIWGNQTSHDATTPPGDALGAWGNYNLEWMVFASCQTLRDSSWGYWATVFDRLHLLLGAHTNIADAKYGAKFGDYLVDNGIFDSAKKVKTSWFDVVEKYNGNYKVAVVLGETGSMGNDYIWGQGPVASDPTHDGWYHYWWFNVGANKSAEGPISMLRPDHGKRNDASIAGYGESDDTQETRAYRATEPVVFEPKTDRGHKVVIDRSLLHAPKQQEMPTWIVTDQGAGPSEVRDIGGKFCEMLGLLCDSEVGPGNPGALNMVDGPFELRVCEKTGSFHFENTAKWMEWMDSPPQLLDPGLAVEAAQQFLEGLGLLPPDASIIASDQVWQGAVDGGDPDQPIVDPRQTFPVASRVSFQRQLSIPGGPTYPTWGPGSSMTVMLGDRGEVQRVYQEGWRDATMGQFTGVMDIQQVIDELNTRGSDATIEGITLMVEAIEIRSWDIQYYEPDCDQSLAMLRPVYVLDTIIVEQQGGQSNYRMYVTANSPGPGADIVEPPLGQCFDQGEQVCLAGVSQTGVPPLSFEWYDDAGNLIGTDNVVCITMPDPVPGHNVYDADPTVELVITDANGDTSNATRGLCYNKLVGAPALPKRLALAQNHPNPFNPTTRISFALPGEAGAAVGVRLRIFDAQGRLVRTLVNESRAPGEYRESWHGKDDSGRPMASGVYYYRLEAGNETLTKRMVLLK